MKWTAIFLMSSALLATEGKMVYEQKCASCHEAYIPMTKLSENFLEKNNEMLKLKAPTLNQLSFRLKQQIGDPKGDNDIHRMEVEAFISDYLVNPDKDKTLCMKEVIKHFDTMPSMKGKITEEEMAAVSEFIYDFDNKAVSEHIVKYEEFDKALEKAKAENKIVMIKATAKHCHFCIKMDREVMVEDSVKKAIDKNFVPVEVDISSKRLPLGLNADFTPTFFFIDENAKVMKVVPGSWNVEDFLEILEEINDLKGEKQ